MNPYVQAARIAAEAWKDPVGGLFVWLAMSTGARQLGLALEVSGKYRRANQDLAQRGNPEVAALGPPEAPTLLGSAIDLLQDSGIGVDAIATQNNVPVDQLQVAIAAGTDTRPAVTPRP